MNQIIHGEALLSMPLIKNASVDCIITSPPYYGLRDYGHPNQLGLEEHPREYVENLALPLFQASKKLKEDGSMWVNIGDSYAKKGRKIPEGLKPKDLIGIPWMLAFALRDMGLFLRQEIIWSKPNPMPESVRDRCTRSHEYIFHFTKTKNYYYDIDSIKEPLAESSLKRLKQNISLQKGSDRVQGKTNGSMKAVSSGEKRNKRSVWNVSTKGFKGAHFAVFPPDLIEPCILSTSKQGGIVMDPFFGSGTTGLVAQKNNRNYIGIELNEKYIEIAKSRIGDHLLEII